MCKDKTKHWIIETLVNDEASSDEELITYFTENGLTDTDAKKWVEKRGQYVGRLIVCG